MMRVHEQFMINYQDDYSNLTKAMTRIQNKQNGVTMIELLVALVIGLIVSLAVYGVMSVSEGRKRTTTSVNDIDKAGAYAVYQLDKMIRSAGSGFTGGLNPNAAPNTNSAMYSFGCKLKITKSATALLPKPTDFPAPFAAAPKALTLAPVVIMDGAATAGDILISMGGGGGLSESITNITSASSGSISVNTTASITANDKLLFLAANSDASPNPGQTCLLDHVKSDFVQGNGSTFDVAMAGDFHDGGGTLSAFGSPSVVVNLGKNPRFNMFGVGANNTLFRYNLLEAPAATTADEPNPSEFVESVFQMEAIYGITDPLGTVGNYAWQEPTGDYASAKLLAGDTDANTRLRNITLVRVALVMKTDLPEKGDVSSGSVTVFGNTTLAKTINGLDKSFRYRVVETTIPIRNTLVSMSN